MQQGRWVSYIFRYRNDVRCENAGFIKVQRMMCKKVDEARIQIGLKLYKNKLCRCMVYLLYNQNQVKYLTDMVFQPKERDTLTKRIEIPWDNPIDSVLPFDSYDGLFFVCDDGEILAGLWHEYKLCPSEVRVRDEKSIDRQEINTKENSQMNNIVREKEEAPDINDINISSEKNEDICRQMLDQYPKLPLLSDSQFLECVKIVPHDIGKLAMSNWKLGVNSFLSHGYYHYKYIMLGKVKFDKNETYVIGVPGVFSNKEKYLANMFGFSVFIPAKKTRMLTGNFGYWISEISSE